MSEQEVKLLIKSLKTLKIKQEAMNKVEKLTGNIMDEKEEYEKISLLITVLEAGIDILKKEEKEIVELHLVEKFTWNEIAEFYEEKVGKAFVYSDRTYKRIQQRAIRRIQEFMIEMGVDKLIA